MSDNILVLIPVNKLRDSLNKTVNYYLDCDLNVVIVDSSRNKIEYRNNRVRIEHYPDFSFYQKIIKILHKYSDNYILLSPDDDIINVSQLRNTLECAKFNENTLLVFGQILQTYENFNSMLFARPFLKKKTKNIFPNLYKKIDYHCVNYDLLLWSLYKKEFLLECMNDLSKLKFENDNFIELTILFNLIIKGDYFSTKEFWMIRNIVPFGHWGSRHKPISFQDDKDIKKFTNYFDEKFKTSVSKYFIHKFINSIKYRILKYKLFYFFYNIKVVTKTRFKNICDQDQKIKNYLNY